MHYGAARFIARVAKTRNSFKVSAILNALQGMSPLESHAKPAAMVLAKKTTKIAEKHTGMNAEGAKEGGFNALDAAGVAARDATHVAGMRWLTMVAVCQSAGRVS